MSRAIRVLFWYLGLCTVLLLLALAARSVGQPKASFYLTAGVEIPKECPVCHSTEWEWGVEPLDGVRVRMQIRSRSKAINPGSKSLKRQERGRQQWRQFKPKPIDEKTGSEG